MSSPTYSLDSCVKLDEKRARELKLYNFFIPQEERRTIHAQLRALGVNQSWARAVRDWSDYHRELFVENHLKDLARASTG